MDRLPRYYFRDIPAYVMEDIISGMINGKPEPTPEEMEAWLTEELEQEAEALLASERLAHQRVEQSTLFFCARCLISTAPPSILDRAIFRQSPESTRRMHRQKL
jgi:hypothetical protein